jgi:RluA family pseudouridine synthase
MSGSPKLSRVEVPAGINTSRLDKFLRNQYPDWGRNAVDRIIQNRQVKVNGKTIWLASWKVSGGDRIEISNPPKAKPAGPTRFDPAWLVADESDLLVVSKPAGLLSQPTRAGGRVDLLSIAQAEFREDLHLFHRLDRDTSGLCLMTRPGPVNAYLDKVFKQREVEKEYYALVSTLGKLEDQGELRDFLDTHEQRPDMMQIVPRGGTFAFTQYWVEEEVPQGFRVRLQPHTGRTHQLRVQLAGQNAPIIGDRLYNGVTADRLMLHAARIGLPAEGEFLARDWESPIPF